MKKTPRLGEWGFHTLPDSKEKDLEKRVRALERIVVQQQNVLIALNEELSLYSEKMREV